METDKVAAIGIRVDEDILSGSGESLAYFLTNPNYVFGRTLLTLGDYLTKYSKKFDRFRYVVSYVHSLRLPNGTWTGIVGQVNRSEIDIGVDLCIMEEETTDLVDFAFPYQLDTVTFMTRKAEYKPQIFGILQTFSMPLWIVIVSTLIAMSLVHYVIFKRSYSFDKILLHVFAVLLRQCSVLKPSSMIKRLLVYSWVVGAMFLCLAYDSVVLSFLSFPPVTQVKDVPQLAKAVKEGHYLCVADQYTPITRMLFESKYENLKIIGQDIQRNNLINPYAYTYFYYDINKPNVALILNTDEADVYNVGRKFVSQDRFLESMSAMIVRKDFCCKKLIEMFVHRFMASGLYFKYKNDRVFLLCLWRRMKLEEKDTSKRVLTLTDVAPALIFLIFGHIISFLVLIVEILLNRIKKIYIKSSEYQM